MVMTSSYLDPIDVLAWDMPPDEFREPHPHGRYCLTLEVHDKQ